MKQLSGRIVAFIFGLIWMAVAGFLFIKIAKPTLENALDSRSWPITSAWVLESKVMTDAGEDENLYALKFKAEYSLAGETYVLNHPYLLSSGASSSKKWYYEFVNEHPVGSLIDIYYNPEKPYFASIEKGFRMSYLILPFVCVVIFLLGFFIFFSAISSFARFK